MQNARQENEKYPQMRSAGNLEIMLDCLSEGWEFLGNNVILLHNSLKFHSFDFDRETHSQMG